MTKLVVIVTEPDTKFVIKMPQGIVSGHTDSMGRAVHDIPAEVFESLLGKHHMYADGVESPDNRLEYEIHLAEDYFKGFQIFDDVEHALIAAEAVGYRRIYTEQGWRLLEDWDRQLQGYESDKYLLRGSRLYKISACRQLGPDARTTS